MASLDAERERIRSQRQLPWRLGRQERLQATKRGLTDITDRIAQCEATRQPAFLIDFDAVGTGLAVIALGDPDSADRVVTHIPGAATALADSGRCLKTVDNLRRVVGWLDAQSGSSPTTALVMWIYRTRRRATMSIFGTATAERAARRLSRFHHGLRVTRAGSAESRRDPYRTLIAHSYGCLVACIAAARYDTTVAAISLNGVSGTRVDHASELRIPRVYATLKPNDPLTRVGRTRLIHNRPPVSPAFGHRCSPRARVSGGRSPAASRSWPTTTTSRPTRCV